MSGYKEDAPTVIKKYHHQVPREEMENLYKLSNEAREPAMKALLIKAIRELNRQIEGEVDGKSIKEPLYRKPEAVVYAFKSDSSLVNLRFDGVLYRGVKATNGSMGFMENRSTVIIQHSDRRYYKLYFDDNEVKAAGTVI